MTTQESLNPDGSITLDEVKLRIVKEFLDLIILYELERHGGLSGYDLGCFLNQRFNLSLSPGTVYATLYTVERRGFVEAESDGKKTTFSITGKGRKSIHAFRDANRNLADFMKIIFPA